MSGMTGSLRTCRTVSKREADTTFVSKAESIGVINQTDYARWHKQPLYENRGHVHYSCCESRAQLLCRAAKPFQGAADALGNTATLLRSAMPAPSACLITTRGPVSSLAPRPPLGGACPYAQTASGARRIPSGCARPASAPTGGSRYLNPRPCPGRRGRAGGAARSPASRDGQGSGPTCGAPAWQPPSA